VSNLPALFNAIARIRELQAKLASAEKRAEAAEHWIERIGELQDICTYDVLGKVCKGCRCKRALTQPQPSGAGE
jgi:hypothetical protein